MKQTIHSCLRCRFWGRVVPWSFMIVAGVISVTPLGAGWQRGSAYLAALSLVILASIYLINQFAYGRRKF